MINTGIQSMEAHNMQVVAHNLMAEYTGNQLHITGKYKPKNTERLSSGYKINRAADDAAAKVDFSGLADKNSATDLYQALYELIGCELAYPCGTCSSETNGIFFSASEDTFTTTGYKQMAEKEKISDLNLSTTKFSYNGKDYDGYFEAVQDVLDKYSVNYDDDADNDITGEDTEVKALAESIAKDLRDKAADKLSDSMKDHFDRVVKGNDDYKQKMQAWEDSATEVTKTFSNTQKVIDTVTPDIYGSRYNANGEKERFLISKGSVTFKEETRTFTTTVKENKNPKPQPKAGDITVETVYSPDSVKYVDDAIDQVSRARSSMGAIRNRLEHAYNNNANTSENTQAAESRLRDTDMAEEMMDTLMAFELLGCFLIAKKMAEILIKCIKNHMETPLLNLKSKS